MLKLITTKKLREEKHLAYDVGMAKGYELGYLMGKIETSNRGFILGSKVNKQIEEILREKGE